MKIKEVLEIHKTGHREPALCPMCEGNGWDWSDLEFGDLPGDEEKHDCGHCKGTGRVVILKMTVIAEVPFNFEINSTGE
jgi:DnaJ-class molecular chaperone